MGQIPKRRLRAILPSRHRHFMVERAGGGDFHSRLVESAASRVHRAETQLTMCRERTHAHFFAERLGLAKVRFGARWIAPACVHGNVTEQLECPSSMPALL